MLLWPVFEGQMLTAGVMGLIKRFRYLLITPSLLQLLTPEELKGVVAHEIGHIRKNHMFFYLLFFGGYALLALLFYQLLTQYLLTQPEVLSSPAGRPILRACSPAVHGSPGAFPGPLFPFSFRLFHA